MNYCEECGAKLQRGMNFCGNCGTPVAADESEEPLKSEEDSVQEEAEEVNQAPLATAEIAAVSPKVSKMKKGILAAVIAVALLAAITIVLWQAGVFSDPKKPADTKPVQTVDQENLYGTLDWKEDQDQEYALKNALIEGNSDANVKELFEESAYFTPKRYQYAMNGKDTYYQIVCQYEKEKKTIPYVLVFQVNEQEHLELAELYRKEKKIDKAKFDSFYKKLYKTKAQVEAEKAEAKQKEQENKRAKLPSDIYAGVKNQYFYDIEVINSEYFEEESEYSYIYVKSIDDDKIITEHGSLEGPYDLTFYRVDDKSSGSYSYSITSDESGWSDEITLTKDDLANQDGYYKIIYTTYENGLPYRINEYRTIWW